MKYLPIESITYQTKLKKEEIIQRLSNNIEPEKMFRFSMFNSNSTKAYEGKIVQGSFNIKRIINYRNSFLPRIYGNIEENYDKTIIKVKMRLHVFVAIFICFWCGSVGLACVGILFRTLIQNPEDSEFSLGALIPFVMLVFGYGLTMGCFKFESNKSKKYLKELFEADIIEE